MNASPESYERPWWSIGCIGTMTPTDIRNLGRFNAVMLLWALAWVGALFLLRSGLVTASAVRLVLAAAPSLLLILAFAAYFRFIRQADELLRKIHVEALGVGFAFGFLLATGWKLFERAGGPPLELSFVGTAMIVGWSIGQALGRRRYA